MSVRKRGLPTLTPVRILTIILLIIFIQQTIPSLVVRGRIFNRSMRPHSQINHSLLFPQGKAEFEPCTKPIGPRCTCQGVLVHRAAELEAHRLLVELLPSIVWWLEPIVFQMAMVIDISNVVFFLFFDFLILRFAAIQSFVVARIRAGLRSRRKTDDRRSTRSLIPFLALLFQSPRAWSVVANQARVPFRWCFG